MLTMYAVGVCGSGKSDHYHIKQYGNGGVKHIFVLRTKCMFLYIAQYPVRWTAQNTLHFSFPGRPIHSDTNSASLGSILVMHLLRNDYSLTCQSLFTVRYSFIQLS